MRLQLDACEGWSEHGRVQGCVYLDAQLVDSNVSCTREPLDSGYCHSVATTGSGRQLKNCRGLKPSMDCYELEAAMF